jgi:hypothetical protein
MNLAQYHTRLGDRRSAYNEYQQVMQWGPEGSADQKRAYPQAVMKVAWFVADPANMESLKDMAALVDRHRSPRDSWILADVSTLFLAIGRL